MAVNAAITQAGLNQIANVLANDIQYYELGLGSDAVNLTDTATKKPLARQPVRFVSSSVGVVTTKGYFGANVANCNQGTVLSAVDGSEFTLQAGQGALFAEGQTIEVDGAELTVITDVTSDILQVSPALSFTPSAGNTVKQQISEVTIWGGEANSNIGTGTMLGRATLTSTVFKQYPQGLPVNIDIQVGSGV